MQNREVRHYGIGGLVIEYDGPEFQEKDYLLKFRTEAQKADIYYQCVVRDAVAAPKLPCVNYSRYIDVFGDGKEQVRAIYEQDRKEIIMNDRSFDGVHHSVELNANWQKRMNSRLAVILFDLPYLVFAREGFFLHASYVIWKERAILFTAPKQTGKTTQAKLWEMYRGAKVINGDRALLRKVDGVWRVYGSPYCGTSKICENVSAPLGAVVLLSQGKEDSIRLSKPVESVMALMDGATFRTWDKGNVETMMNLAGNLIKDVPMYKLECTPTEKAVRTLEEVLW